MFVNLHFYLFPYILQVVNQYLPEAAVRVRIRPAHAGTRQEFSLASEACVQLKYSLRSAEHRLHREAEIDTAWVESHRGHRVLIIPFYELLRQLRGHLS
jgi:hypothetical protein